jgi:lipoate---protein ligase
MTPRFMRWLDLTFPTPAENLACDEALLDLCEAGFAGELLRFWESPTHFVVVGYGNKVASEVDVTACEAGGIPVLRRCSGGGTVFQGPGCLNYSLILCIDARHELESITSTNCHIMKRNAAALSRILGKTVSAEGFTDLAIDGQKFSGNAQRRKRTHLLFHGTFLLDFDLALIERYLRAPSREPDYRLGRRHVDFLRPVNVSREELKRALRDEWQTGNQVTSLPAEPLRKLVLERYSRPEWNLKF